MGIFFPSPSLEALQISPTSSAYSTSYGFAASDTNDAGIPAKFNIIPRSQCVPLSGIAPMMDLLISYKDPTGDITQTTTIPIFKSVYSVTCILIPSGSDIFTTSILCLGLANSSIYPGVGIFGLFDGTVIVNFVFSIAETAVRVTETACTNDTTTISGPTTPGFTATTQTYFEYGDTEFQS